MFLQLYDKNHNKIAGLAVAKAATVESVLSTGDGTLSFLYPLKEAVQLVNESYIRTKTDEYVIKEVQPDSSDLWCSVKATLNVEDLEGICWPRFESVEQTIDDCLKLAIAGTGWTIGSCAVTRRRTIRKTECSGWDIIQQARKTYRCEIWFDTIEKKIHIAEKRGQDKGMYFTDTLNLRKLAIQSTSYDFCTRIKAEGKDGLTFKEINGGKDYVENYQYSNKVLTKYWKDERYTNAQSLLEDTTAKLEELSKPVVAYSGDILDLAKASPKTYRFLDFGLGDTVELVDSTTGTKEKQRIVKITEYPDEPEKNTCEFANRTASFEELQQEQNEVNSTVNNITSDDGTISPSALDLDAITIHVQNIYAQELNAVKARIGELETTTLKATEAIINTAMIEELLSKKATILDLNALTARVEVAEIKVGYVDTLVSDVADIKTLVNGNLTSVNIQAGGITSDSLTIRNGFITNAMIGSVEAGKITTGILNTSLVTIQGADGRMAIKDNTIQIKDASRVRVQIGKDAAGDYSMYVWDASGALMFDAAGLHAPGIKSGIIRNDMVADNAGIAGTKIDIVSLITSINGNTTKIDSTVIKMDSSGQTLNLAFSTLKTTAEMAKSTTETHTTQINAINGKIDTLIQDTTIVKDGQTVKLKDEYNKTVATVGGIQTTIGNQQTTIANLTNDLNNLSIGGRNLFRCSGNFTTTADLKNMWSTNGGGLAINNSITYLGNPTIQTTVGTGITGIWYELEPDTEYTYSIMVKASAAFTGSAVTPINYWTGANQANEGKISVLKHDTSYTTADVGKFKKLYIVFKLVNGGKWFKPHIYFGKSQSITFYIANLKLEKGNKPTDWTPAPEDTQGQITEVKTQQATFEQTLNGFSTTVSSLQTAVSGKADGSTVNTLSNRITAMETNLDGFKTTVSNTYTTKTELTNLKVGNRNLLRNSGTPVSNTEYLVKKYAAVGLKPNTVYTVVMNGYTSTASKQMGLWFNGGTYGGVRFPVTTTAKTQVIKVTSPDSFTVQHISIYQPPNTTAGTATINWIAMYEGDIKPPMDWTPAPEDVDASITAVDSKFANYSTTTQMNSAIDQKANQINLSVSQNYTTKTEFNTQMSINQQTKQNGIELFDQTYRGSFAALPFAQGAHTIVSATAAGGASTDSNLIKTVNAPVLYTDYMPCNIDLPYYWSCEVYSEGTTDGVIYVQACFYNDKQAEVATNEGAVNLIGGLAITKANTWQKAEGWCGPVNTLATHKKACYMRIRYLPRYNGKTGVTYMRNISFKQLGANQIATTNQLQSALLINVNSITSRVTAVETKATTTANGLTNLTSRVSTAEQKITPAAITNAVTSAINGGQASFQTASMTLTSTGLTVDASKFIVRYGGVDLMKLEAANSQLSLRATLQQYNKSTGYKGVEVVDNKIQFYDHTTNGNFVGGISSVVKSTTQDQPGMSVYYDEPDRLGLGYKRTSDGKIIHSMELRNKTININEVTNFSTTVYFNGPGPWMPDVHGKGGFALTLYSNQYIVCRQEANNSIYIPIWAGGFNTGSSRATKDNIVPIQDGSSIIRRSEICSYNLKADLQQGNYIKKYGLIAEDAPDEVVTQDRKAIDLYSMVSIGWKATQEIILENDLRDAKIEHLQREIGELKSKIWQLEQRLSVA